MAPENDEQKKPDEPAGEEPQREVLDGEVVEGGALAKVEPQAQSTELAPFQAERERLENCNDDILSTLKDDVLAKKNELEEIQRDFRSKRIAKKMYVTRLRQYAGAQEKLFERKVDMVMQGFDVTARNKLALLKSIAEHSAKQIVKSSEVDIQKTILDGLNEVNQQFLEAMEKIMRMKEMGLDEDIIKDSIDRAKKLRETTLGRIFEKTA